VALELPIELEFRNAAFVLEGGKPENPEKTLGGRTRTNNKLNPLMTPGRGFEPRPHWWEANALTTGPPLLSLFN